jgi:hypothetical protein
MAAAALPAVAALTLLGLALALSGSGGTSAVNGCDTALKQPASAGDTKITVQDPTESCGADVWIVINQGSFNQDCMQVKDPHTYWLDLYSPLQ